MSDNQPRIRDKSGPKVQWFDREIFLNELYFVCFSDEPRELTRKEQKDYDQISIEAAALQAIAFDQNPALSPKVHPLTGRQVLEWSEKFRAYPQFDIYFNKTHKLVLVPMDPVSAGTRKDPREMSPLDFFARYSTAKNNPDVADRARKSRIFLPGQ